MRERKRTFGSVAALSVAATLALTGCGSGGGDGSNDGGSEAQSNESFATTQGTAAKGIIRNGVVTAIELNSNGTAIGTVGTTRTNNEGKYTLPVSGNYNNGPVLLKVTASEDGTTTMVCDVSGGCGAGIGFGDTLKLDGSFEMSAIIPSLQKNTSVAAHITPFTHMAARRAMSGEVNDDTVKLAISEVNKVVGIDIRETAPIDITKTTETTKASTETKVYAAFLAAAGKLAVADSKGLAKGLDKLANTFKDGKFDTSDDFTITDLIKAVEDEAEAVAAIDTIELRDQIFVIEAQTANGTFDPESSDTAPLSPVAQAKALVSNARTWIDSIAELETPMEAFTIDIDDAAKVFDANSVALAEMAANIITSVAEGLEAEHKATNALALRTYPFEVNDLQGQRVGSVDAELSNNNGNGLKIVIPATTINGVTVNMVMATNIPETALSDEAFNLESAELFVSGSVANNQASIELNGLSVDVSFKSTVIVNPDGDAPEVAVDKAALSGEITLKANGVTFNGNAGLKFVQLIAAAPNSNNSVSLREAKVDGKFTASDGGMFSAAAKLTINNASTFDTFALLDHQPRIWVYQSEPGDPLGAEAWARDQNASLTTIYNVNFASDSDETYYSGTDSNNSWFEGSVPGDPLNARDYILGHVNNKYPSAQDVSAIGFGYYPNSTSFSALVNLGDFETAEDYANATLSVSFDLALQGYPETRAVITGNRNALDGGDIRMSLVRKGLLLTFIASLSETDPITGKLSITNADGAKMELSGSEGTLEGTLRVKGTKVGTVAQTDDGLLLVRYQDGTFETLH